MRSTPIVLTLTALAVVLAAGQPMTATAGASSTRTAAPAELSSSEPTTRLDLVPSTSLTPTVAVAGGTAAARRAVDEAVTHFVAVGMALPDLDVAIHDDEEACHGHLGRFTRSTPPWSIDICSDAAFVPTHELAHAWLDANVDPGHRPAIVQATGASEWRGEASWEDRGVERAAFIIQQVLMAGGGRMTDTWADRIADFELITGRTAPDLERWDRPAAST